MKQEKTDYIPDDLTKRPVEETVQPIPEAQLNLEARLRAKSALSWKNNKTAETRGRSLP